MRIFLFLILNLYTLFANAHIFVYHRFDDPKHSSANTTTQQLINQFEFFKKNNYEVVRLSKLNEYLQSNKEIPENWVALTIDDAYKSFYEHGLKTFKQYGYPFTLFVYVNATEKRYGDFMTWDHLKEVEKFGGEIALHSFNHPHLPKLSDEEILEDTKKSYDLFEKRMGYKPKYYTYPYGEYDNRVEKLIRSFGFDLIFNQNNGSVRNGYQNRSIDRIALVGDVNLKQKIKYNTLEASWIEPQQYPKDGILKEVKAKVSKDIKNIKLYISDYGWVDLKVKDGIISHKLQKELKRNRVRVILSTDYFTVSTKILTK
jgi:peptidoglycan/xylan/chitin deacetylase (PgdA/CDA1 family)